MVQIYEFSPYDWLMESIRNCESACKLYNKAYEERFLYYDGSPVSEAYKNKQKV